MPGEGGQGAAGEGAANWAGEAGTLLAGEGRGCGMGDCCREAWEAGEGGGWLPTLPGP